MPRIYLAGPMVFTPNAQEFFAKMKKICQDHGLEGVSPFDGQISINSKQTGKALTLEIVKADFELMDQLDGAIFCLDSFRRSTEMDPGTAVEIGYMKAQNKPMYGWTTDKRDYPQKVNDFFNQTYHLQIESNGLSNQLPSSGLQRDPDGILVHSEGMYQNGMTQGAIELAGGEVFCSPKWEDAFRLAAEAIAQQFKLNLNNSTSQPPYRLLIEKGFHQKKSEETQDTKYYGKKNSCNII
ncbi:Nucleoside 2-deoxyribosyltransferase [Legionella busanensis]|uniref:Nucleoside 2-deoxyribosyltransferase n=1 Tax=Legionella busanensis TaxID=190655 RepID=A0A378JL08_9GAMM|nr:nucleoside 2-deoxyribosyltransferase [Legionella busanensis]STX51003.1 Nucleoside 2-deoxyribosyltransferase [Legionella busanensis]